MLKQAETVQTNIQTIKDAFLELQNQNQDLFDVLQTLIQEIVIHPDGTIDIQYTFEEPK
ncbi:hypothetical protein [Neobacillus jeddahensis]|uniref:hypothetical protein n=1 Tax=Neobacillus jeddahensis TaxID=1461580 RepID=UPI000A98D843|nr:hypothetical protein [Neobacillus jeddahensis]